MSYDLYNSLGSKGQTLLILFSDPDTLVHKATRLGHNIPAFFDINLLIVGGSRGSCSDHVPCFTSHPASEEELQRGTFGATPRADPDIKVFKKWRVSYINHVYILPNCITYGFLESEIIIFVG